MWSFWRAYYAGEVEPAVRHSGQALDIAERLGDSFSRTWSRLLAGGAAVLEGRWDEADEALRGALSMAEELRTAAEAEPWALSWLADAHRGREEPGRALELAEEALASARSLGLPYGEMFAGLARGWALLGVEDESLGPEIERTIQATLARSASVENPSVDAQLHVQLAELARLRGEDEERERRLGEAHRLFTEIGARGHAERLAGELAALERQ